MKRLVISLGVLALATSAFAAWNVTILNSSGTLYSPATPITVPTLVQSSPVPQITFQTAIATPNPFIVGMGTGFKGRRPRRPFSVGETARRANRLMV